MIEPRPLPDWRPPVDLRVDADWPDVLVEIAEVIGPRPALLLAMGWGGMYMRVPPVPDQHMLTVLGHEPAALFCARWRTTSMVVPMAAVLVRRLRRRDVIARVRTGEITISDAARQLDMHVKGVGRLIKDTNEGKALAARQRPLGGAADRRRLKLALTEDGR